MGMDRGFSRIGRAIMAFAQPFLQMEAWMSEMSDAIARIESNLDSVSSEITQVTQVLQDLAARPTVDEGTTAELNSIADRLAAAKDSLENATSLDDQAPAEPPTDQAPAGEPPAEPAAGEEPPVPGSDVGDGDLGTDVVS